MNASLQRIWVVFSKEVSDNLRDRRSIASALSSTLIGPVIILLMIVILGKTLFNEEKQRSIQLPVIGSENAPALVQFLEQQGVKMVPGPADPESAVRNGDLDIVLVIPAEYGKEFEAGRPAPVRLVLDTSRQSALATNERVRTLLENFSGQIATLRLMARGLSPVVVQPLAIERMDVSTPQTQALIFLNMMPYFVVLVVFMGGMHVIIDSTAGERERSSLEPLLINPVARWEFVVGKLLASIPFAILTTAVTLLAFAIAFNVVPVEEYVGFQLSLNVNALLGIFLIALPMILLASSLQMIVASFTRSFKEAQTYTAFLPLIPALPGIGLAFMPVKASLPIMLIPTFGQQLLINQLMRGEPLNPLHILVSTIVTVVLALALILVAVQLYSRERILFGTK